MLPPCTHSAAPARRRTAPLAVPVLAAALSFGVAAALTATGSAPTSFNVGKLSEYPSHHAQGIWGFARPSEGREFVLLCRGADLAVIEVTDPSRPIELAAVPSVAPAGKAAHDTASASLQDVRVYGGYAFAINQYGPVQIIDIDPPEQAYTAATFTTPSIIGAHTIEIDGHYAYLSLFGIGPKNLHILDIANPLAPVDVGQWRHPDQDLPSNAQAHDCYVYGNRLYSFYLEGGVGILDITDRSAPQTLGIINYPGSFTHSGWTTNDGQYLLTCDELYDGHLRVFDVSNPANAPQVGEYRSQWDSGIHNVYVRGRYAFIAYYSEGFRVVDLIDPTRPAEVAFYDTYKDGGSIFNGAYAAYPYAPSGRVYVSDMNRGLFTFEFAETPAGWLNGIVRDRDTGAALAGVDVTFEEAGKVITTGATGQFAIGTAAGSHTLTFSRYGYLDGYAVVDIDAGVGSNNIAYELAPVASAGTIDGRTVSGDRGVSGARIQVISAPNVTAVSSQSGSFLLYPLPGGTQEIVASKFGFLPERRTLQVVAQGTVSPILLMRPGIMDDAEFDQGWQLGAPGDDATDGQWERAIPYGTWYFGAPAQPDGDQTPAGGRYAFVTGASAPGAGPQENNLNSGRTTLLSPEFSLAGSVMPVLRYHRWFFSNLGANQVEDWLRAEISNNGGQSWTTLEEVTGVANEWVPREFTVAEHLAPTNRMSLRFIATDGGISSLVEAAIDDITIDDRSFTMVPASPHTAPGLAILGASPNPFEEGTGVRFTIGVDGPVSGRVFDATGRLVRELPAGVLRAGENVLRWDGADAHGRAAASGMYWIEVSGAGQVKRAKVLRLQ